MLDIIKQNNAQLDSVEFNNDTLIIDPTKKQIAFAEEGSIASVIGGGTSGDSGVYNLSGTITRDEWNTLAQQYHTFVITGDVTIDISPDSDTTLIGPHIVRNGYLLNPKIKFTSTVSIENVNFYGIEFTELNDTPHYFSGCNLNQCRFTPIQVMDDNHPIVGIGIARCIFDLCSFDCSEEYEIWGFGVFNNCTFYRPYTSTITTVVDIKATYQGADGGDIFLKGCDFGALHHCSPQLYSESFDIWVQNCKYKNINIGNSKRVHFSDNIVGEELQSDSIRMITNTYKGDGKSTQTINLGVTPKAVIVCNSEFGFHSEGKIYGGLAIQGTPCIRNNNPIVQVCKGGFTVGYDQDGSATSDDPNTNTKNMTYLYIAFI